MRINSQRELAFQNEFATLFEGDAAASRLQANEGRERQMVGGNARKRRVVRFHGRIMPCRLAMIRSSASSGRFEGKVGTAGGAGRKSHAAC